MILIDRIDIILLGVRKRNGRSLMCLFGYEVGEWFYKGFITQFQETIMITNGYTVHREKYILILVISTEIRMHSPLFEWNMIKFDSKTFGKWLTQFDFG